MKRMLGLVAAAAALTSSASATVISFDRLTSNSSVNVASQFAADVTDLGGGLVNFRFTNTSVINSSITDIYFDGDIFADITNLSSTAGVKYGEGAAPANLPSGNNMGFDADLAADSDNPTVRNGVNTSTEWLDIVVSLENGFSYGQLLSGLSSGSYAIGLHVQSIGPDANSDSFYSRVIPAPGAALLGLIGAGTLAAARRRG